MQQHLMAFAIRGEGSPDLELDVYDVVGGGWFYGGATASNVRYLLKNNKGAKNIKVRINSVGGDFLEGMAIYNQLRMHGAHVTVQVDGLAGSIASVIAMAGDDIIVPDNGFIMIHNPVGSGAGEGDDLRSLADIVDKAREMIANVYVSRTGQSKADVLAAMDAETWMTGTEAKKLGYCTQVVPAKALQASAWGLDRLSNVPDPIRIAAKASSRTPPEPRRESLEQRIALSIDGAGPGARDAAEAIGSEIRRVLEDPDFQRSMIDGSSENGRRTNDQTHTATGATTEKDTMKGLFAILGLVATATEDDAIRAVTTLKDETRSAGDRARTSEDRAKSAEARATAFETITGKAGDEALGVVKSWKESNETLAATNAKLLADQTTAEVDSLFAKARTEGRVTPDEETKMRASLESKEISVGYLRGYLPGKAKVVNVAGTGPEIREVKRGGAGDSTESTTTLEAVRHDGKAYEDYTLTQLANLRRQQGGETTYQNLKASWEERGKPKNKSFAA